MKYIASKSREIALLILNKYSTGNQTLDKTLENNMIKFNTLSNIDRAFTTNLVYTTIRWKNKLDWIINIYSKKEKKRIPSIVLNILRIGLVQILFMNRIPNSALVNTAVNLTKEYSSSKYSVGYVNAILRNTIRYNKLTNFFNYKTTNSLLHLSILKSFPKWILSRWTSRFGTENTCLFCDSINSPPSITIRINILKTNKSNLKRKLNKEVKKIENFNFLPNTLVLSKLKKPIYEMKSFLKGMFSVQDAAAQIASHLISPRPGETILDACTGFGTKATHMAQLMKNKGKIVAIDNLENKLEKLIIESKRLNISIIQTMCKNLENINLDIHAPFDRILIDAPCSGLGVIRKNPDIKWSSSLKKIYKCSKKQLSLLKNISKFIKPKGLIAYVVCSLEPEENEEVINKFLVKNSNFKIKQVPKYFYNLQGSFFKNDSFFRTCPSTRKMDGFFIALLERKI